MLEFLSTYISVLLIDKSDVARTIIMKSVFIHSLEVLTDQHSEIL